MPIAVKKTEACKIILENGSELIDGISSWWSTCHGYNHPHIIQAMRNQLETMPHVMFAGINHDPALTLAKRLAKITPAGLNRVFFSDSGSVAVEVAMKMAVQYWKNKGDSKRNRFISFNGGYHGDTMGAMSVSCTYDGMHKMYNAYMPMQFICDIPNDEYAFAEFDELLSDLGKQIAGLIIEPLVQCAGGFKFHSADILAELYRICKKHGIIFIADEIATGFGRTGYMFACEEAGITPDIMCLGKALSAGHISLAATIATDEIFNAFLDNDWHKALMHGPTFMANPLAAAAANASLDLFESEPRLSQVEAIESKMRELLAPLYSLPCVRDVRVKGAIGVVEYDKDAVPVSFLRKAFIDHGVWLRPLTGYIYVMPPFIISDTELEKIVLSIHKVLNDIP